VDEPADEVAMEELEAGVVAAAEPDAVEDSALVSALVADARTAVNVIP